LPHYIALVWRQGDDELDFTVFDDDQPPRPVRAESDEEVTGVWRLAFYAQDLFF
jgi:hypothetical protein